VFTFPDQFPSLSSSHRSLRTVGYAALPGTIANELFNAPLSRVRVLRRAIYDRKPAFFS